MLVVLLVSTTLLSAVAMSVHSYQKYGIIVNTSGGEATNATSEFFLFKDQTVSVNAEITITSLRSGPVGNHTQLPFEIVFQNGTHLNATYLKLIIHMGSSSNSEMPLFYSQSLQQGVSYFNPIAVGVSSLQPNLSASSCPPPADNVYSFYIYGTAEINIVAVGGAF